MRYKICLMTMLLVLAGCQTSPQRLVIFHTNDIHGHFASEISIGDKDSTRVGGVIALSEALDSLRRVYPNSLYLDAGDLMTGNPICNLEYGGVKGGALLELLHRCGVMAMTLGNHEFDLGPEHLRKFISASPFPMLNANILEKQTDSLITMPAEIFRVGILRVGVIGLIMDNLAGSVAKWTIEPFVVKDAARSAQQLIDKMDPQTDLIVFLTHIGVEGDSILATKVSHADVIVGGHSHTRLTSPKRVNGVLIVQAGSYCKDLGILDLEVAGDSVLKYDGQLLKLIPPANPLQTPVTQLADSLDGLIQKQYGEIIGELKTPWNHSYYTGSNAGNWLCDRLRDRCKVDVAFINSGGIRADIPAGEVHLLNVMELLPFMNSVVIFSATGNQLLKAAEEQARAQGLHAHGALEMSGITVHYKLHDGKIANVNALIDGKPVDPARTYRVATIDYVAMSQWDRHLGFRPDAETTGDLLSDVIADEIRKSPQPIIADSIPRLVEDR